MSIAPTVGHSGVLLLVLFSFSLFGLLCASCGIGQGETRIHHVNSSALPCGDGTAWDTAFTHPQDALDVAAPGDEIWVAEGRYGPRTPDDTTVVVLKRGVALLGGFAGNEVDAGARSPEEAATVLDGQCSVRHVVLSIAADGAVLDGFTITGGRAFGDELEGGSGGAADGGGMFNALGSPEIRRCRFVGNIAAHKGGGLYSEESAPLLEECIFEENRALFGAAMNNYRSAPTIVNSVFRNNRSEASGGAVSNFQSSATFVNSIFSGNESTWTAGAVLSNASQTVLTNCTFNGNRCAKKPGGALGLYEGQATLINCILWGDLSADSSEILSEKGNVTVGYTIIQGGYPGEGNLDLPPGFVEEGTWETAGGWSGGDYRLKPGSAAIDSGTSEGAPGFDLAGILRPQNLAHDRGAYEHRPDP